MTKKGLFSVSTFAKLSRTTRDTLHHYDKMGLISPALRGDNQYRYYSHGQLAVINLIRTMQELGLSLAEIKELKDLRTPQRTDPMLLRQVDWIDAKIAELKSVRKLVLTLQKAIHSVADIDETLVTIKTLPAEAIVLGGVNDYSDGAGIYEALLKFYQYIATKHPKLNLNYPVWGMYSQERILAGDWNGPDRYYFYNPDGHDSRPAGLYAVGYARGGYGQSDELYARLLRSIDEQGYEVCGNVYEEYPLNEVCIADSSNYLIRVMASVRKK